MEQKPAESKFAAQLRELGFRPMLVDAKELSRVSAGLREKLGNPLPKRALAEKEPSFFFSQTGATVARDELGVRWFAKDHIDLTSIGFTNAMPGMANLARLFQEAEGGK